jgi:NAD(P)-dependent dehydrogenase (short-subunit alcohol dehydrogenase family)
MDLRLKDRPAIVFGGAGGIGARIARELAAEGARIAIADREGDAAQAVAASIGHDSIGITCD